MDSKTGMCRIVANKQGKTYQQELLGTVEIEDAVSLHTLSTAII